MSEQIVELAEQFRKESAERYKQWCKKWVMLEVQAKKFIRLFDKAKDLHVTRESLEDFVTSCVCTIYYKGDFTDEDTKIYKDALGAYLRAYHEKRITVYPDSSDE